MLWNIVLKVFVLEKRNSTYRYPAFLVLLQVFYILQPHVELLHFTRFM